MITLTFGTADPLDLPPDLAWQDARGAASQITQLIDFTRTGAPVVEEQVKTAGRPLTLTSGETYGWARTALVDALDEAFEDPETPTPYRLTIGADEFNVILDRAAGGFAAEPFKVRPADARPEGDWWKIKLVFRVL